MQVIAAEREHKASSALAQAAQVIEESPHALQVGHRFYNFITNLFDSS